MLTVMSSAPPTASSRRSRARLVPAFLEEQPATTHPRGRTDDAPLPLAVTRWLGAEITCPCTMLAVLPSADYDRGLRRRDRGSLACSSWPSNLHRLKVGGVCEPVG